MELVSISLYYYPFVELPSSVQPTVMSVQPTVMCDCSGQAGGLGTLIVLLILLLVGVILGWVWSPHRRNYNVNTKM